ncbi:hypothetical protein EV714DRAFT_279154 [Schizophyllum commune]
MSKSSTSIEEVLNSARAIANKQIHRTVYALNSEAAFAVAEKAHALRQLEQQIDNSARETFGERIQEQLVLHDALLAPWRRLPLELLSAIFLLAVPDGWEDMYAGKRNWKLRFIRVCYQWRRIARSIPHLWSTLRFDNFYSPLPNHLTALKDELEKTAQAPLKVTIRLDWCPTLGRVVGWSDEAWALFCPESHRFTKLWLKDIPLDAYEMLMGRDFPLLEDLTIRCEDQWCGPSAGPYDLPLQPFLRSPRVSRLRISHAGPIRPFTLPRAWILTRLSVRATNTSLTLCLQVAMTCTATLLSLHVAGEERFGAHLGELPRGWGSPRCFPLLEELYLGDDANLLSRHVLVPNLRILRLTADPFGAPKPEESLQLILGSSSGCPSLIDLSLKCYQSVSVSHLMTLLRQLRPLQRLSLSDDEYIYDLSQSAVSLELIHELARDDDNPSSVTFLPNLVYIKLEYGHLDPSIHGSVERIYTSRQGDRAVDGVPLASLRQLSTGGGMHRSWPNVGVVSRDYSDEEDGNRERGDGEEQEDDQ